MSFGQRILALENAGTPVETMWMVFDQQYRNSYVFAAELFRVWLFRSAGMTTASRCAWRTSPTWPPRWGSGRRLQGRLHQFNENAAAGEDPDFERGRAYDRYYGDPTISPNPNCGRSSRARSTP